MVTPPAQTPAEPPFQTPAEPPFPAGPAVPPAASGATREFLDQAIRVAVQNVSDGGGPFGAVVVTADSRVYEGANRVALDNDPTAHAEVVAIRAAAAASGTFDLSGAVLYASCEPCPLCLAAALWARVDRVYFAADRNSAAAAGFDDALFYQYFDGARPELMPVRRADIPASGLPFQAWAGKPDRTEY